MKPVNFENKILNTVSRYEMIRPGSKVLVGLSGGADSVTLLTVLHRLKSHLGIELGAVHVNHNLRGKESDRDEEFARSICKNLGIDIWVSGYDVLKRAKETGESLELAGRRVRREAFQKALVSQQAQLIALGHNLDDNAETVLMRLCRGTALTGLCGIQPKTDRIIRPLIETSRREIEEYCKENGIDYKTDSSNLSTVYTRNKIRHGLIPLIKKDFNPNINETLKRMTEVLTAENSFLEEEAEKAYAHTVTLSAGKTYIDIDKLTGLHIAVQRRTVRLALERQSGCRENIYNEHIEAVLALTDNITGKITETGKNLRAEREYDKLVIYEKEAEAEDPGCEIPLNQEIFIPEIKKYIILSAEKPEIIPGKLYTKIINYDKIKNSVQIRTRQPGDKIFVKSMGGHKKLSDYFIDRKLPKSKRDKVPLLVSGSEIIMILDDSAIVSDKFTADGSAEKALYISVYSPEI